MTQPMHTINSDTDLRAAILHLESVQAEEAKLLKAQFHLAYDSIKPINLIKNTLRKAAESHEIKDNIVSTAVGLTTGYLSKMLFESMSDSPFKKILGVALQFGITTVVANHPEVVKAVGNGIWEILSSMTNTTEEEADDSEAVPIPQN